MPVLAGIDERFPIWTLADVLRVLIVLVVALIITGPLSLMIALMLPAFRSVPTDRLASDPRIVLSSMGVAYGLTVWFIFRMLVRHYEVPFFESLHWRWPRVTWSLYVVAGAAFSIALQFASTKLPVPKELPIDKYFISTTGTWLMALFGTFFAPFCEELFFRGLLFPPLAKRLGLVWGVILTSVAFAAIHAAQLARALGPVLLLFVVGLVLTLVRARTRSLATTVLMHMGYNGIIFLLMFMETHGFHNLDKLTR
jgi:uncharacterized protein